MALLSVGGAEPALWRGPGRQTLSPDPPNPGARQPGLDSTPHSQEHRPSPRLLDLPRGPEPLPSGDRRHRRWPLGCARHPDAADAASQAQRAHKNSSPSLSSAAQRPTGTPQPRVGFDSPHLKKGHRPGSELFVPSPHILSCTRPGERQRWIEVNYLS